MKLTDEQISILKSYTDFISYHVEEIPIRRELIVFHCASDKEINTPNHTEYIYSISPMTSDYFNKWIKDLKISVTLSKANLKVP